MSHLRNHSWLGSSTAALVIKFALRSRTCQDLRAGVKLLIEFDSSGLMYSSVEVTTILTSSWEDRAPAVAWFVNILLFVAMVAYLNAAIRYVRKFFMGKKQTSPSSSFGVDTLVGIALLLQIVFLFTFLRNNRSINDEETGLVALFDKHQVFTSSDLRYITKWKEWGAAGLNQTAELEAAKQIEYDPCGEMHDNGVPKDYLVRYGCMYRDWTQTGRRRRDYNALKGLTTMVITVFYLRCFEYFYFVDLVIRITKKNFLDIIGAFVIYVRRPQENISLVPHPCRAPSLAIPPTPSLWSHVRRVRCSLVLPSWSW